MNTVLCFGEALIDFLNQGKHPDGPITIPHFYQYPGGAPANAAVAVAKLGGSASFVGQVGNDTFGHFLQQALHTYKVDTRYLLKHPSAKTALAFVTLDDDGDRSFAFYRDNSADVIFQQEQLHDEMFNGAAVLHFCSNTLTTSLIASTTSACVAKAKHHGLLVSFDVNLRHNLWQEGLANIDTINQFVDTADILKFSKEEIEYLAVRGIDDYIRQCLSNGCKLLVVTDGSNAIQFYTQNNDAEIPAPIVKAVDTTAGGDAFSGGLLYQLAKLTNLDEVLNNVSDVESLIRFAAACGAHVVQRPGAFPALPTFEDVGRHCPNFIEN